MSTKVAQVDCKDQLAELARALDSASFVARELAWQLPQRSYRQHSQSLRHRLASLGRQKPKKNGSQSERALCLGKVDALGPSECAEAYVHAVDMGAHGLASALDQRIAALPQGSARLRSAYLRQCIALGRLDAATTFAKSHFKALRKSDSGQSFLSELGLKRALVLPSGRINTRECARQLDANTLSLPSFLALCLRHIPSFAKYPEQQLLLSRALSAAYPKEAQACVARYFRALGKPPSFKEQAEQSFGLRAFITQQDSTPVSGPLVSIVLTAFQSESTVVEAVQSLLNQSYQDCEILVGDDASTDSTLSTLQTAFSSNPKVRIFAGEKNQGTYSLRNQLVKEARGELLSFHDADDYAAPSRVALQVASLEPSFAKISIANLLRIEEGGKVAFFRDLKASRMATVSMMLPTALAHKIGPFRDVRFGADFEFLERAKRFAGKMALARIHSPELFCRWSESSVTKKGGAESLSSGYRGPLRRAYSDWVYKSLVLGEGAPSFPLDQQIGTMPAPINEL